MLSDSELESLAREELEKRKTEQFAACEILGESLDFPPMKTAAF